MLQFDGGLGGGAISNQAGMQRLGSGTSAGGQEADFIEEVDSDSSTSASSNATTGDNDDFDSDSERVVGIGDLVPTFRGNRGAGTTTTKVSPDGI